MLHVEDDETFRAFVSKRFRRQGVRFVGVDNVIEGLRAVETEKPDLVLLDVRLPRSAIGLERRAASEESDRSGVALLHALLKAHPDIAVAVLSGLKVGRVALEAMRAGALDYFSKSHPADLQRLEHLLDALCAGKPLPRPAPPAFGAAPHLPPPASGAPALVGSSQAMLQVKAQVSRLATAPRKCPVMILGETGTGKDLVAQVLHARSGRSGQLVRVNCAAISHELFESELFGHEAGSFTGATTQRQGALELAASGTLLLDEVAELPLNQQAKLLSCLEYPFRRVGGRLDVEFTGHLVVATNKDLGAAVRGGEFRQDLYHRIAGARIELPSLRARREDIAELAEAMLESIRAGLFVARSALAELERHSWPGNVRELQRVLLVAASTDDDGVIGLDDLPPLVEPEPAGGQIGDMILSLPSVGSKVDEARRLAVLSAVKHCGGNESRAARELRIDRKTLSRILHPTPKPKRDLDS